MSSHDNTQGMNIKGLTSVKYSGQMPGGNSNFSLGGDYGGDDDRFGNSGKPTANKAVVQQSNEPTEAKYEEAKQEEAPVMNQHHQVSSESPFASPAVAHSTSAR